MQHKQIYMELGEGGVIYERLVIWLVLHTICKPSSLYLLRGKNYSLGQCYLVMPPFSLLPTAKLLMWLFVNLRFGQLALLILTTAIFRWHAVASQFPDTHNSSDLLLTPPQPSSPSATKQDIHT